MLEHSQDSTKLETAKKREAAVLFESTIGPRRCCSDEDFFNLQVYKFGEQNDSYTKYDYDDQLADAMFYVQNYAKKPCSF